MLVGDQAATEFNRGTGGAKDVARRMAGIAVAEPAHQVCAAVPSVGPVHNPFECARCEEQRAPHRERDLQVKGEAQCVRPIRLLNRGLAAQERKQRVGVVARDECQAGVRKRGIEQAAVF